MSWGIHLKVCCPGNEWPITLQATHPPSTAAILPNATITAIHLRQLTRLQFLDRSQFDQQYLLAHILKYNGSAQCSYRTHTHHWDSILLHKLALTRYKLHDSRMTPTWRLTHSMPQDQWGLVGAGGEENNSEHEQQVVVHLGRHVKVGHMITCHVMRSIVECSNRNNED